MAPKGASSFPSSHSCTSRSCIPTRGCPQSVGSRVRRFRSSSIRPADIGSAFLSCTRPALRHCDSIGSAMRCIFPISSYLLPCSLLYTVLQLYHFPNILQLAFQPNLQTSCRPYSMNGSTDCVLWYAVMFRSMLYTRELTPVIQADNSFPKLLGRFLVASGFFSSLAGSP